MIRCHRYWYRSVGAAELSLRYFGETKAEEESYVIILYVLCFLLGHAHHQSTVIDVGIGHLGRLIYLSSIQREPKQGRSPVSPLIFVGSARRHLKI